MAVVNFFGQDPQAYGWDITQFKTEEEKAVLEQEIRRLKTPWKAFNDDGLIFFAPEMNLGPWLYPDDSVMKQRFFFIYLPSETEPFKQNWLRFYERVKRDFDWRCFTVNNPNTVDQEERYVFYKHGVMPIEPNSVNTAEEYYLFLKEPYNFDTIAVEQGGILFKNRDLWQFINRELAFNDNTTPFIESLANHQIIM